jgi:COP9 signalosome complex subunit 4
LNLRCYTEAVLEADEAIDAEVYVNKASSLINAAAAQSKASAEDVFGPVQLRFRVTYARVMDANRKFVEAAVRYYGLSTTTGYNVRFRVVSLPAYKVPK